MKHDTQGFTTISTSSTVAAVAATGPAGQNRQTTLKVIGISRGRGYGRMNRWNRWYVWIYTLFLWWVIDDWSRSDWYAWSTLCFAVGVENSLHAAQVVPPSGAIDKERVTAKFKELVAGGQKFGSKKAEGKEIKQFAMFVHFPYGYVSKSGYPETSELFFQPSVLRCVLSVLAWSMIHGIRFIFLYVALGILIDCMLHLVM